MSKGLRRSHYHVYQDLKLVSTHQDRQEAWRRVAQLSGQHPVTTGWNVANCYQGNGRPDLRPGI